MLRLHYTGINGGSENRAKCMRARKGGLGALGRSYASVGAVRTPAEHPTFISSLQGKVCSDHPAGRYMPALDGTTRTNLSVRMDAGGLRVAVGDSLITYITIGTKGPFGSSPTPCFSGSG